MLWILIKIVQPIDSGLELRTMATVHIEINNKPQKVISKQPVFHFSLCSLDEATHSLSMQLAGHDCSSICAYVGIISNMISYCRTSKMFGAF